jgi:hypothetical protein
VRVEEREAVPDAFLVELGDLQLGEEKLGEWDRLLLERQAVTERDLVRHAESGDEDVEPPVLVVEEEEALVPVQRVEGNVGSYPSSPSKLAAARALARGVTKSRSL